VIIFAFMRTLSLLSASRTFSCGLSPLLAQFGRLKEFVVLVCRYIGSVQGVAGPETTVQYRLEGDRRMLSASLESMCDSSPLSRSDGLSWICEDDAYSVFCGHDGEADFA
jgi:hypothetical protein